MFAKPFSDATIAFFAELAGGQVGRWPPELRYLEPCLLIIFSMPDVQRVL